MYKNSHRLALFLEIMLNGSFILLYSLQRYSELPQFIPSFYAKQIISYSSFFVPFVIFFHLAVNFVRYSDISLFFRRYIFSITVFFPLLITFGDVEFTFLLATAHLLSSLLSVYEEQTQEKGVFKKTIFQTLKLRPAQLVMLTFFGVIVAGTFLLMLPISSASGKSIGFVDALFTSTSATCVTGLVTLSTANDFSLVGQIVILVLIQVGALSVMTLYSSMAILLGNSIGIKERLIMQDLLSVSSLEELFARIGDILKYTFFIELWGALILTLGFLRSGLDFGTSLYYGIFHSVSAFCNAGFALYDTSLEAYASDPLISNTIIVLITLGGLGFLVLKDLKDWISRQKKWVNFGVHSKVVLITSLALTLGGTVLIFFGEFLHALDGYSVFDKLQISLFQSVTLRTAGFNTIPLTNLHSYTLYLMALIMFIGGSPGSTAGGVKTTTLAILARSIISTLRGQKQVTVFDRTIPSPIVVRAIALMFLSIVITSSFILLMMKFEPNQSFLAVFFEVISASATVGLSLGVTPLLSAIGKVLLSLLMFTGRIGPLTLILAIGQKERGSGKVSYPSGRIMIG